MSFNFKRFTWFACKNIAMMTTAIFLASTVIVGTVYVLSVMFGPAGMTIVLPLAVLVLISIAIAYRQTKTEEHKHTNRENRRKVAEKHLASESKTASSNVTTSKTASK